MWLMLEAKGNLSERTAVTPLRTFFLEIIFFCSNNHNHTVHVILNLHYKLITRLKQYDCHTRHNTSRLSELR